MKMHYLEPFWTNDSKASSETPYDDLAAAIVKQAANDYVRVIRKLWQKNLKIIQKRNLLLEKVELEEFFYSSWYSQLTDIDPEKIIARCVVNAREKEKQAIRSRNKAKIRKMLKEQQKQLSAQDVAENTAVEPIDTVEGGKLNEAGKNITGGADRAAAPE